MKNMLLDKNDILNIAKNTLHEKDYTCVLYNGEVFLTSNLRGVAPLIKLIGQRGTFEGFCVADKVIGKAAALLYVKMKISCVYADTISEGAVSVFENYGVPFSFSKKCEYIINRKGDDLCPMEKAVKSIFNPEEAFTAICERLAELKQSE